MHWLGQVFAVTSWTPGRAFAGPVWRFDLVEGVQTRRQRSTAPELELGTAVPRLELNSGWNK